MLPRACQQCPPQGDSQQPQDVKTLKAEMGPATSQGVRGLRCGLKGTLRQMAEE